MKKEAKNVAQINISCDNVVFYDCDNSYIPELKISVVFPETTFVTQVGKTIKKPKHTVDYWMSPFRDYRFQVSASIDGHQDCGSTEVIGLSNMITVFEDFECEGPSNVSYNDYLCTHSHITTQIYDSMIRACLMKFIEKPIVIGERYDGYKITYRGYMRYSIPINDKPKAHLYLGFGNDEKLFFGLGWAL